MSEVVMYKVIEKKGAYQPKQSKRRTLPQFG
jgi:hypothetical protein